MDFSLLTEGIDFVESETGCFIWQHHVGRNGYGQTWIAKEKKVKGAHVVAWEYDFGPIPFGMEVCHHCDVRSCINVEHLFLGTRADNLSDMRAKNRDSKPPKFSGEQHPGVKLTDSQVNEVRQKYTGARGQQTQLAAEYGVTNQQIHHIVRNKQRICL